MNAKIRTGILIGASSFLLLSACISTSFRPAQNFDTRDLSPGSPAAVRVLRSPPNEAFLTLGEIVVEISGSHSGDTIIRKARERAATIGADTIIFTHALSAAAGTSGYQEGGAGLSNPTQLVSVTFTAIRRLPEDSPQRNP
jgi:hypothetical protein